MLNTELFNERCIDFQVNWIELNRIACVAFFKTKKKIDTAELFNTKRTIIALLNWRKCVSCIKKVKCICEIFCAKWRNIWDSIFIYYMCMIIIWQWSVAKPKNKCWNLVDWSEWWCTAWTVLYSINYTIQMQISNEFGTLPLCIKR